MKIEKEKETKRILDRLMGRPSSWQLGEEVLYTFEPQVVVTEESQLCLKVDGELKPMVDVPIPPGVITGVSIRMRKISD